MNAVLLRTDEEDIVIKRMNNLRGLFAILIVLGHSSMNLEDKIILLDILHKFNLVSVCFFLTVSGFSLAYNVDRKNNYLKGFIMNKPFKIFIFACICDLVTRLLTLIVVGRALEFNIYFFTAFNWYIYEIIFFYLIFYFSYKFIKNKNVRCLIMFFLTLFMSLLTLYLSNTTDNISHSYHFSAFAFLFGILLHVYYRFFRKIIDHKFKATFILSIIGVLSCVSVKMPQGSILGGIVLRNLVGISIIGIIFIWAHYIDYGIFRISAFFTKYSTEIYLYQFAVLSLTYGRYITWHKKVDISFTIFSLIITVLLSLLMHYINLIISKILSKIFNKAK